MNETECTPIYVSTATDDTYVQHCAVTLFSLCHNNPNIPLKLYVLTPGLKKVNEARIRTALASFVNVKLTFIDIDDRPLRDLDNGFQGRCGKANYYRLLLPELLGQVTDKILYIDADVVIDDDITSLWNTKINSYYFAAVENPWHRLAKRHEGTGLPHDAPYFNSGIMLLNLRRLTNVNLIQSLVETKLNPNLNLMLGSDMDPLNSILKMIG